MVEITGIGTDTCGFSGKTDVEGVYCRFTDGFFEGFLSWASFKKLLALRSSQKPKETAYAA